MENGSNDNGPHVSRIEGVILLSLPWRINKENVPELVLAFTICHLKLSAEPLSNVPDVPAGPVLFIISPSDRVSNVNEDKSSISPFQSAIEKDLKKITRKLLSELSLREERVLRMRFGIDMNRDHTLEEVGDQFDVTRERVRQIEAKALRKLRHPIRSSYLKDYIKSETDE